MQVTHSLGILSINKNVNENAGFLLTNKKGGYCSFFNIPSSRYQGLFYFDERKKENVIEAFLMPKGFNSLIYELDSENEVDLILDCKNSYDNREWGRYYDISEEKGFIIVKFTKKN